MFVGLSFQDSIHLPSLQSQAYSLTPFQNPPTLSGNNVACEKADNPL